MDLRIERQQALRHTRRAERYFRLSIGWAVYDPARRSSDDVYDIGQATYRPLLWVPVLWLNEMEADNIRTPEGRQLARQISFGVTMDAATQAGVPDVENAPERLNDVIVHEGGAYRIDSYEPTGNWPRNPMAMQVDCERIYDWDYPENVVPVDNPRYPGP